MVEDSWFDSIEFSHPESEFKADEKDWTNLFLQHGRKFEFHELKYRLYCSGKRDEVKIVKEVLNKLKTSDLAALGELVESPCAELLQCTKGKLPACYHVAREKRVLNCAANTHEAFMSEALMTQRGVVKASSVQIRYL